MGLLKLKEVARATKDDKMKEQYRFLSDRCNHTGHAKSKYFKIFHFSFVTLKRELRKIANIS